MKEEQSTDVLSYIVELAATRVGEPYGSLDRAFKVATK
jgi:hypothetical protein